MAHLLYLGLQTVCTGVLGVCNGILMTSVIFWVTGCVYYNYTRVQCDTNDIFHIFGIIDG